MCLHYMLKEALPHKVPQNYYAIEAKIIPIYFFFRLKKHWNFLSTPFKEGVKLGVNWLHKESNQFIYTLFVFDAMGNVAILKA